MENQVTIVLNFSRSVGLRLANAEPVVIMPTAVNMSRMWITPKKAVPACRMESLNVAKNCLMTGLLKYNVKPIVN